jgi:hypothetical protein
MDCFRHEEIANICLNKWVATSFWHLSSVAMMIPERLALSLAYNEDRKVLIMVEAMQRLPFLALAKNFPLIHC